MAEPAMAKEALRRDRDGVPDAPRADSLWRLFEAAHVRTQAHIADYAERAAAKGALARQIRIARLALAVLGVVAPGLAGLAHSLRHGWTIGAALKSVEAAWAAPAAIPGTAIGYVLLALAGGLLLFARVSGASQAGRRERQAQARLQALAVNLRYAWAARLAKAGGAVCDAATVKDLADLILTHAAAVDALTGSEAGAWTASFAAQLGATGDGTSSDRPAPSASNPPRA
jgi:hypothetical protein